MKQARISELPSMSEHMESSAKFSKGKTHIQHHSILEVCIHGMGSLTLKVFSLMFDLPELRLPTKKAAEAPWDEPSHWCASGYHSKLKRQEHVRVTVRTRDPKSKCTKSHRLTSSTGRSAICGNWKLSFCWRQLSFGVEYGHRMVE